MDELEAMAIYDNEIAPLEQMIGKLEDENNRLVSESAKLHRACMLVWNAWVEPRRDWKALKLEIAMEKIAAIATDEPTSTPETPPEE